MKVTWLLTVLAAASWAAPEATQTSDAEDWSALASAMRSITAFSLPSKTGHLENLASPPRSLFAEIVNNVPPTALAQIVIPAQRSALASDFKAGKTPVWYQNLPTDVKSYISVVKSQIADGALTATTQAMAASETPTPVTTADGAAASTSSEGVAAAARPTGVMVSGMGALGVLGVALAL
ncbi:hypothetical protein BDV59DRAFT_200014 [Aspergillus ambiguus]|uniref:uncharacterized protein n=1 Tax=Aspergillus ambiguus TaxID=176160 RepID=UPI003CCE2AC2